MARDLDFYSSGTRCSASFWPGPFGTDAPAVVLCHGFRGIRAWFEPGIAELFQAAGVAVLTFDYRGFGDSDGQRGRLVPTEQVEDIRNALTVLGAQRGVDPTRLALFGTSFGGANAVAAAAVDERVRATVCVVGLGDVGRAWAPARRRLDPALKADRDERVRTGQSATIDPAEILDNDQSRAAFAAAGAVYPDLCRAFPLEAVERVFEFAPERVAAQIAPRALLLIGARTDHAVPIEETTRLYEAAAEPKRVEILPLSHYDVYTAPHRETVVELSLGWFAEHLTASATGAGSPMTTPAAVDGATVPIPDDPLRAERCAACGRLDIGRTSVCPTCWSDDRHEEQLSGIGVLYAFTVIRVARTGFEPPYAVGYADLAEGLRVFGHVDDWATAQLGGQVRVQTGPVGTHVDGGGT